MNKLSFEKYLEEVCFEANPTVLDDDMPDFFDDWLGNQNGEDYIRLADAYAVEVDRRARADWLRSEIEKLEGMKQPITIDDRVESAFASIEWDRYNEALTTIITRYTEELKELESKI